MHETAGTWREATSTFASLRWKWGRHYSRLSWPLRLTFGSHGRIHPLYHISLCLHLVLSQTAERPCRSTQKHRKRGKVIKGVRSPHRHNSKQLEHHLRHQCPTGSASGDSTGFHWYCCHAFFNVSDIVAWGSNDFHVTIDKSLRV